MKTRTITSRNFLGGFLGGFFGILICALIHKFLLPIGCLGGVVIGFWYQEIFQAFIDSWYKALIIWNRKKKAFRLKMNNYKLFFTSKRFFLSKMRKRIWFPLSSFFSKPRKWIGNFLNIKASPFINWLGAHPMNRAMMFALVSLIVFVLVNFIWLVPSLAWLWASVETTTADDEGFTPLLTLFLFVILLAIFVGAILSRLFYENQRDFFRDFGVYSNKGIVGFMLYKLYRLFLVELVFAFFFAFTILYFVSIGAFFLTFIFFPATLVLLFLKALYEIAVRKAHFLCFVVTLVTTIIFAWQTYPYFDNRAILLTVALATGCVSGALTEGIRRIITGLFEYEGLLEVVKLEFEPEIRILLAPVCRCFFINLPDWLLFKKIPSLV